MKGKDSFEGEYCGFVKFKISAIHDNSIINKVDLHIFCYDDKGEPLVDIRKLTTDPFIASWNRIFTEIRTGTLYVNDTKFSAGSDLPKGQWLTIPLGPEAADDLQDHLKKDWFAIGFIIDDNINYTARCYGVDKIGRFPYIMVDYKSPCQKEDPLFPDQWHLLNTGNCGIQGEDINISSVWDITKGASSVIAIVDDGLEIYHEDLV